jgi:hypothetical protein
MPLGLLALTTLRPDCQGAWSATRLVGIPGTGHVAFVFAELRRRDLGSAETLPGVLGTSNRVAPAVAEGDTGVVGDLGPVKVRPLREDAWGNSVCEAAGVGPRRVGRRGRGSG